jgi:hypothetical protein
MSDKEYGDLDGMDMDEPEADALFDEGNIIKMPEQPTNDELMEPYLKPETSDPVIDCAVLLSQRDQAHAQVRDLERQLQQKDYELDLNGGMARLNVAGDILTGYAAAGHLPTLKGETRMQAALRYADELCSDFEERMTARANEFMKHAPMSPSDEINPAGREN